MCHCRSCRAKESKQSTRVSSPRVVTAGTKDLILTADFLVPPKTLASSLKAAIGALFESSGEARAFEFMRDFIDGTRLNFLTKYAVRRNSLNPNHRLISKEDRNTS
jgi:dsRNA-specific ribonuclease